MNLIKQEYEYDNLFLKFEVTTDYVDGGIERVNLEKDTCVVTGLETHAEKILDFFIDFMGVYGFSKETILDTLDDYVQYCREEERIDVNE